MFPDTPPLQRLYRLMTRLAGLLAVFLAVAPALAFAYVLWSGKLTQLAALATAGAAQVSEHIVRNPDIWRYAPHRAQALIERSLQGQAMVAVDILDVDEKPLILSSIGDLPGPLMTVTADVYEYGMLAGHVRLTVSWRDEALLAALAAIIGCLIGYMIFFPLRRLPLAAAQRAYGRLAASEAALRKAQAIAHIGSWRLTAAGRVLSWSDETCHIFDCPVGAPVDLATVQARIHPDDRARAAAAWEDALRGGACDLEYRVVSGDSVRWVRERAEAYFDGKGAPAGVDGTVEDVTERRDFEAQLRLAKEQAEAGNRAKTRLLANMSHELRTPLNAVIGLSESMALELFGPLGNAVYRDYARQVLASGERLLELVGDLLYAADLEAGELALKDEALDVAAEIAAVAASHAERAAAAKVAVRVAPLLAAPTLLRGDGAQFRRILSSLLSNAVAFSPQGGAVTIEARRSELDWLEIAVSDHGAGMSREEVATAFRPFGQLDTGLARRHGGTGLGLSIAIGLAQAHGGRLSVQSVKGEGSVFTVAFPPERVAFPPKQAA